MFSLPCVRLRPVLALMTVFSLTGMVLSQGFADPHVSYSPGTGLGIQASFVLPVDAGTEVYTWRSDPLPIAIRASDLDDINYWGGDGTALFYNKIRDATPDVLSVQWSVVGANNGSISGTRPGFWTAQYTPPRSEPQRNIALYHRAGGGQ